MKKRNLVAGGLSVMLLLGATNQAFAQDDSDDGEDNNEDQVEHAILSGDYAELADILDVIEIARAEFEGVITEFDFDNYDDGYYYDFDMASESEEFHIQIDAVSLDTLELDRADSDSFFEDGELDPEYAAKLQGDINSLEDAIESTREYFDGIITNFEVDDGEWMDFYRSEDDGLQSREYSDDDDDEMTDEDNGTDNNGTTEDSERIVVYQFTIVDDHLELEIEINAADLSIIDYEIDTKDDDSEEHADKIESNIQDYEPINDVDSDE